MRTVLRDVMVSELRWVASGALVRHAAALMAQHEIGSVLVAGEGEADVPLGIVTETDFVRRVITEDRHPWATLVNDVMSRSVIALDENRPIQEAVDLMTAKSIRHLGVRGDGGFVGLVVARDVITQDMLPVTAVRKVMARLLATIPMHGTSREAAARMSEASVGSLLVTGRRMRTRHGQHRAGVAGDIAGIMTEADLVSKLIATDRYPYVTPVAQLMETRLRTIDAEEPIRTAGGLMAREGIRHLIVTDGPEEIVGLLSMRDLLRATTASISRGPAA